MDNKSIILALQECGTETDDAIRRLMGDETFYITLVKDFFDECIIPDIKDAMAKKDYDVARLHVHSLKGLSANLGFIPLKDAANQFGAYYQSGMMNKLESAYAEVIKQHEILEVKILPLVK